MPGSQQVVILIVVLGTIISTATEAAADDKSAKTAHVDAGRMRQLIQVVQTDPDDSHRKAAILELSHVDPRSSPEAMQAIIQAVRKDASTTVRLTAVEAIARSRIVFPTAGAALEQAIQSDTSLIVRAAARQALWEYHLIGYKGMSGGDGFRPQTVEPPVAKATRTPAPITAEPPILTAAAQLPPQSVTQLPIVGPLPGPRVLPDLESGSVAALLNRSRPIPNFTVEPPLAVKPGVNVAVAPNPEPPIRQQLPEPSSVGVPHPFARDLPLIVLEPGPIPGVVPFPVATGEPPIRRAERR